MLGGSEIIEVIMILGGNCALAVGLIMYLVCMVNKECREYEIAGDDHLDDLLHAIGRSLVIFDDNLDNE